MDMYPGANGWAAGRWHSWYSTTAIKRIEKGQFYNQALTTYDTMGELYDVSMVSESEGWMVGKGGALLHLVAQNVDSYSSTSIATAKSLPDGSGVILPGVSVTGSFTGEVYVEQEDRTSGIKVLTNKSFELGRRVRVTGVMATENGERLIRFGDITDLSATLIIDPYGLNGRGTSGRTNYQGADNVGLLVKLAGNVSASGSDSGGWFTLDDGSGLVDALGNKGVLVRCNGVAAPTSGFKTVTGISSFEMVGPTKFPVLRVRQPSDIQ
jgi:hypothetical protein